MGSEIEARRDVLSSAERGLVVSATALRDCPRTAGELLAIWDDSVSEYTRKRSVCSPLVHLDLQFGVLRIEPTRAVASAAEATLRRELGGGESSNLRPSFFRRTVGALLPQYYSRVPTSDAEARRIRGSGVENDGVFANVLAKPTSNPTTTDENGDVHVMPEDSQKDAPPVCLFISPFSVNNS